MRDLAANVALTRPDRDILIRGGDGRRTLATVYGLVHGHFRSDNGQHLDGVLRLSVVATAIAGDAEVDFARTCIVYARGAGNLASLSWMYRERWSVETMLEQLLNTKPASRAKTIQADCFQFVTLPASSSATWRASSSSSAARTSGCVAPS